MSRADHQTGRIRRFLAELRRRKVHRAAALYLLGGYAAVEASDLLVPLLQLPDWSTRLVLALVLVGFPLAMALAWAFEITPGGLVRTPDHEPRGQTEPSKPPTAPAARRSHDGRTSILVAPFSNNSPDPENEYIADGLTEEIITDLSGIESLRVIARSSAMRLKGSPEALTATARELAVNYVLDGSVRKSGDELRITVQLVDVSSEETRWSERYSGSLDDLFEIHEQVARSVTQTLPLQVSSDEMEGLADHPIEDPRALESYLRARYETWQFSREGLENAERHLKNGLAIVGDSALLYATLGHVYTWYTQIGLDPDGSYRERAAECVEKVFALEPDSSRGHFLEGTLRFEAGELRSARAPLERALEGRPDDPDTVMMLAYLCALSGQHGRATALFDRLLEVDPLTPFSHASQGFVPFLEGRFQDALEAYRTYREMDPDSPFAVWCWMWILLQNGRRADAEPVLHELVSQHPDSLFAPLGAGLFHGVRGDAASAREAITDELRQAAEVSELFSRELTRCLALAEETEEALDWLENTIRIGNVNYPFYSRHDPWMEGIRSEPRFERLMEQVRREWKSLNPELAT